MDSTKVQQIWDLLSDLYSANSALSEFSDDRRTSHAASLVVAAWKARQSRLGNQYLSKPDFVGELEFLLSKHHTRPALGTHVNPLQPGNPEPTAAPVTPVSFRTEQDSNAVFDLDFEDIDWSFWNSID